METKSPRHREVNIQYRATIIAAGIGALGVIIAAVIGLYKSEQNYYRGYEEGQYDFKSSLSSPTPESTPIDTNFIFQQGYSEGEVVGYAKGYDEGEKAGNEKSYRAGYDKGYEDGITATFPVPTASDTSTPILAQERPIPLWALDYFTINKGNPSILDKATDNYGNTHNYVLVGWDSNWMGENVYRIHKNFNLNKNYKWLTGTIFLSYSNRSLASFTPRIRIVCDGIQMRNIVIKAKDEPIEFEVDLTGVQELEVEICDCYPKYDNTDCTGGVSELYLWK